MALMRFDPFRDFDRLTQQMLGGVETPSRVMPMEAFRRGDEFTVLLDMPGISPDDVDLTVENNVVTIRAERRSPRQEGDEVIVDERPHGTFVRQLFLGDNLDAGKLQASYDQGVLSLTIPVAEESKPRRVQIAAQQQQSRAIGTSQGEQAGQQEQKQAETTGA
jgi:HSP20 family protein